ncbi:MAG: Rpn family recombination-promoting nuclease/putative transposase [Clostridiales bacterium]|nr:Rpn family recombination-promoting nuclease/putative transposase [Clostridiales bacterium]
MMVQRKPFKDLQFCDDFMFVAVMEEEDLCRRVLERILQIPICKVTVRTEAPFSWNPEVHGIRMDAYAYDGNTVYDIEMQTGQKNELPKRSRYIQSMMDTMCLDPGQSYKTLPKSFIIFICTFDPFGDGRYCYRVRPTFDGSGKSFDDDTCRIFLNTKGENESEVPPDLLDFLRYVDAAQIPSDCKGDPLLTDIETRVATIKRERGRERNYEMMLDFLIVEREEAHAEGRAEGMAEGRAEGKELIKKLLDDNRLDDLRRSLEDPAYQQELIAEYGLSHETEITEPASQ